MIDLAIIVPVLGRPHRVDPLLQSIQENTPHGYTVLFITDSGDTAEKEAIQRSGADFIEVDAGYAGKINAGVRATTQAYLFLGADDLRFHARWYEAAIVHMNERRGVVGTNDLGNRAVLDGRHATHSLVARWYTALGTIDDRSCLLHEGYHHNFVDDEFVATAKHRHAFFPARSSVVEHMHPDWGKADRDATYIRGRLRFDDDGRLFHARSRLWT